MSPLEAAQTALAIARKEKLPLATIARYESDAEGAVNWFVRNIRRFFEPESNGAVEAISNSQLRRYVAWMRTTK
ncbi:MAG: hypothetical protein ACTHLR_02745 [Rhizomicrobium sp.]